MNKGNREGREGKVKKTLKSIGHFLSSYKALTILWLLLGIAVLVMGSISRLNYFCVWIILLLEMIENCIEEDKRK